MLKYHRWLRRSELRSDPGLCVHYLLKALSELPSLQLLGMGGECPVRFD